MERYDCEKCDYRKTDVTFCFPCMMQILAERRKKKKVKMEDKLYDEHEQK